MAEWNHRGHGGWDRGTLYRRENGQWVEIDRGGSAPGEFGWVDPPSRSTTEYHSAIGGSVQDAFEYVSSDTELVLDDGPYAETATLPSTDHVTISGVSGDTVWEAPGDVRSVIDAPGWSLDTTSCSAIDEGDATLSVGDASIFSPGDDVQILDPSDVYYGMTDDELYNTYDQYKGEFAVVDAVDTGSDTITLESGTHQHYDDPNGDLEVSAVSWAVTDVHITNFEFQGGVHSDWEAYGGTPGKALSLWRTKDLWLTDLTADGWHQDLVSIGQGRNSYLEECHVNDVGRYGISHSDGQTHSRVRNCTGAYIDGEDSGYLVQCGGGGTGKTDVPAPTYDIRARNCSLEEGSFLYEAHFGAENVRYADGSIDSGAARPGKLRGIDQHLVGGTYGPATGWSVQSTQVARRCSLENMYVSDANHGWVLWPKEDQWFGDLRMENVQFENMSGDPIVFRETDGGDPPDVRGIDVVNSSWNGEWIDRERIEDSNGYDSNRIDLGTIEYPDDQTPDEYFG